MRPLADSQPPSPRALLIVIALLLALQLPTLGFGFLADDYGHQSVLAHPELVDSMKPWSLYDFGEAPLAGSQTYEHGAFAWWCVPPWKVRFLRPLPSLWLWLDHAIWGAHALPYHAANLLVFALVLALAHALYLELGLRPRVALLALALFGLENSIALPLAWLAQRNSLLELAFQIGAVLAFARRERMPRGLGAALALALAVGACLSKESGIASFALLALWALLDPARGERAPRREWGFAALCALGALAYLALLLAQGYGARTPFYATPWGEPALFAQRTAQLLIAAPAALASAAPADLLWMARGFETRVLLGFAGFSLLIALWARPLLRGERALPFLLLWMLVCALPQGGGLPSDRLLGNACVASSALFALALARGHERTARWFGEAAPRASSIARAGTLAMALLAVFQLPAMLASQDMFRRMCGEAREAVRGAEVGARELGRREAILLQSPNPIAALSPLATWIVLTGDEAVRFWPLQMGRRGLRITRTGERALALETLDQPFLSQAFESVLLVPQQFPARPGFEARTALFRARASGAAEGGGVARIDLEFDEPLDAPRLRWLSWREGAFRRVDLPAIGASIELPELPQPYPFAP